MSAPITLLLIAATCVVSLFALMSLRKDDHLRDLDE